MTLPVLFTFATLAVWRATYMVVEDEGPFGVFRWVREHVDQYQKTWVGRGLNCMWCVSWWTALAATLWLWYFGWVDGTLIPIWWFALSAGSCIIQTLFERVMRRR